MKMLKYIALLRYSTRSYTVQLKHQSAVAPLTTPQDNIPLLSGEHTSGTNSHNSNTSWKPFKLIFNETNKNTKVTHSPIASEMNAMDHLRHGSKMSKFRLVAETKKYSMNQSDYMLVANLEQSKSAISHFTILHRLNIWGFPTEHISRCRLISICNKLSLKFGRNHGVLRHAVLLGFAGLFQARLNLTLLQDFQGSRNLSSEIKVDNLDTFLSSLNNSFINKDNYNDFSPLGIQECIGYICTMSVCQGVHFELLQLCVDVITSNLHTLSEFLPNSDQVVNLRLGSLAGVLNSCAKLRYNDEKLFQGTLNQLKRLSEMKNQMCVGNQSLFSSIIRLNSDALIKSIWSIIISGFSSGNEILLWEIITEICHGIDVSVRQSAKKIKNLLDHNTTTELKDFQQYIASGIPEKNLYSKEKLQTLDLVRPEISQLQQVVFSLCAKSPILYKDLHPEFYDALFIMSHATCLNVVISDAQRQVGKTLTKLLSFKVPTEQTIGSNSGLVVDFLITPLTDEMKQEILNNVIGPRVSEQRYPPLDHFIADLQIPFLKPERKGIVIEVNGSFHYITNLELLYKKTNWKKPHMHRHTHLSTSKTVDKKQNDGVVSESSLEIMNTVHKQNVLRNQLTYLDGTTIWKAKELDYYNWESIPVSYTAWQGAKSRHDEASYLASVIPIDWKQWNSKMQMLREFYSREIALNETKAQECALA